VRIETVAVPEKSARRCGTTVRQTRSVARALRRARQPIAGCASTWQEIRSASHSGRRQPALHSLCASRSSLDPTPTIVGRLIVIAGLTWSAAPRRAHPIEHAASGLCAFAQPGVDKLID